MGYKDHLNQIHRETYTKTKCGVINSEIKKKRSKEGWVHVYCACDKQTKPTPLMRS